MPLPWFQSKKHPGQPPWHGEPKPPAKSIQNGWRFSLKGSPRHYDDVRLIIESDPGARVYFGEALTYERGAGVALWRVEASSFDWLPKLYAWWAEMERVEPIRFTFHLYFSDSPRDSFRYPALDLRDHTPEEVIAVIKERGARTEEAQQRGSRRV
jgi:hypothetical protein